MDKDHIVSEIRRLTKSNNGVPPGINQFCNETGIRQHEWRGRFWARWGDAISEAGFTPNTLQAAYDEIELLERYIELARSLGRLPVPSEIDLRAKEDSSFPSKSTYLKRFGPKSALVVRLQKYCESRPGYDDISNFCNGYAPQERRDDESVATNKVGFVYLLKHGSRREYKIGKTFNPIRREGEIVLQLPEKIQPVHYIHTDDPSGVETYWHNRFAAKRKEGEWFELSLSDVQAFKKWKRIL
jgi:hypothetical protein